MTGTNLLTTSLLRSWGLLAILPILVLQILNVSDRASTSFDHWPTALDSVNGVLIVVNPLVAGIVCAETLVLTRGSQREMINVLPHGGIRVFAARAAATAAPIILLHLAVIGYVLTQSNTAGSSVLTTLFPIVPAVLSIFAYSAIGVALGCLFPYLVVPPLATVGLYLLALMIARSLPDPLVEFGGASGVMLGIRNRPDVLVGQTLWLLLLASVFLMIAVGTVRGYARLWPRAVLGAAVITAAGFGLGSLGDLRFEPQPINFTCTGSDPEVCVAAIYADKLEPEADRVSSAVRQVEKLGIELPTRFEQGTSARAERQGEVGYFTLTGPQSTSPYENLILSITQSVACETDQRPQIDQVNMVIEWAKATEEDKPQLRPEAEAAMGEIASCA